MEPTDSPSPASPSDGCAQQRPPRPRVVVGVAIGALVVGAGWLFFGGTAAYATWGLGGGLWRTDGLLFFVIAAIDIAAGLAAVAGAIELLRGRPSVGLIQLGCIGAIVGTWVSVVLFAISAGLVAVIFAGIGIVLSLLPGAVLLLPIRAWARGIRVHWVGARREHTAGDRVRDELQPGDQILAGALRVSAGARSAVTAT